jgi:DNA-binding transcriptional regulator/RsmH inhibitor MraZ
VFTYGYTHSLIGGRIELKIQALPSLNPEVMRWQRLLIGYAYDVETDKQGRALILYVIGERINLNINS